MLPLYKKISYSMGRFGSTSILAFTELVAFYVYGKFFSVSWFLSGFALSISYVVIGVTHWLTGYYSDQTESKYGRRKQYVIVGTLGLAISCFLLFVPNWFVNTAEIAFQPLVFIYYLATLCVMKFFYAILVTSYQAWMPEITEPGERPLISALQNTANWVATGISIGLALIIPSLFAPGPPAGLTSLGLVVLSVLCILGVIMYLPSILFIREKTGIVSSKRVFVDESRFALGNKDYVGWIMTIGFLSFSFTAITSIIIGFSREILLLGTIEELAIPALALVVSILLFMFVWIKVIAKSGKRLATFFALIILGIQLFLVPLVAVLATIVPSVILGIVFFVPLAACMAVYYLVSYVVTADIAHADEIITGEGRAGIYEGLKGIPFNFFQALSVLLLGFILEYSVITTGTEVLGLIWWGPIYAPFLFIGALVLRYIDIDPEFDELEKKYKKKTPKKRRKKQAKKTTEKKSMKKVKSSPKKK